MRVNTGQPRMTGMGTTHHPYDDILFFIQATDRIGSDGKKYLCIETIQSDVHQTERLEQRENKKGPMRGREDLYKSAFELRDTIRTMLESGLEDMLTADRDMKFPQFVEADRDTENPGHSVALEFISDSYREISRRISGLQDFVQNFATQFNPNGEYTVVRLKPI